MPKITEEKINKRKALYLKHKNFLDDFYKFFKGSFVQKQGREIVIKLDYKYNSFDKKTNKVIEKPYTVNIFNKAIKELEELGLIKSQRYYKTNNKSISYCKPLLCLILNVDNQTNFPSPSFSRTTNTIYDTNLFKGYVILNDKTFNYKNQNTMFKNNQELLDVYLDIYKMYLNKNHLKEDENSNQFINLNEFFKRTQQIKNLKTNPITLEKNNYDLMKKYNKFNYCNFETLHKRNIYLKYYFEKDEVLRISYCFFCFENMNVEKFAQYAGDTIQTTLEMFDGIYKNNKIDITIYSFFLSVEYAKEIQSNFYKNLFYDKYSNERLTYYKSIEKEFKTKTNIVKFNFCNAGIINNYREGNQRQAFEEVNKTNMNNKIKALESKKEG